MGERRLTRGDTDLDMCPDSTVHEYITSTYGSQSDCDRRVELVLARFSSCLNVCISVNSIMASEGLFSTEQRVFIND